MRKIPVLVAVALLLSAGFAHARVAMMPLKDRIAAASLIALAKVTAVTDATIEDAAYTKVTATPTQVLKGESPKELTFYVPKNRRNQTPKVDSEYILLLKPNTEKDTFLLSGFGTWDSLLDPSELDTVKKAIADEKAADTK